MPITSAVGHADAQAILDELGQPLLDELGQVIYDFEGFTGFGWATAIGAAIGATFASGAGAAAGSGAAAAVGTKTSAAVGSATGSGAATATAFVATTVSGVGAATGSGAASARGSVNIFAAVGLATGSGAAAGVSPPVVVTAITVTTFYGTKLYIGGTDDFSISPDDVPWIEIGNIFRFGDYGGTDFAKVAQNAIGDDYTRQLKELEFAHAMDLLLNRDDTDPGQAEMRIAAVDDEDHYNFKIEETVNATTFARTIFRGQVFGFVAVGGGVNDVKRIHTSIEVDPDTIVNTTL